MSAFLRELLEITKTMFPGADQAEILPLPKRALRISWKTHDDPDRPNKRYQPIIIELHPDFLAAAPLPDHVNAAVNREFTAFLSSQRAQFKPRTTESPKHPHTPDHWTFRPSAKAAAADPAPPEKLAGKPQRARPARPSR